MNEFTDQNSCRYADELVSYLYDEASEAEKSRFEVHLVNCSSCADELADFSTARAAVADWREAEFTPLAIPSIQLPVRHIGFTPEVAKSGSLAERIRAFLSLSPALAGAGAAALIIGIGLLLIAVNFQRQPETARVEKEAKSETIPAPQKEETAELRATVSQDDKETVAGKSSEPATIEMESGKSKTASAAIKVSSPDAVKNKKIVAEKSVKSTKTVVKKSSQSPPPTLLADEDDFEDNSLRLADIFRGIGGG